MFTQDHGKQRVFIEDIYRAIDLTACQYQHIGGDATALLVDQLAGIRASADAGGALRTTPFRLRTDDQHDSELGSSEFHDFVEQLAWYYVPLHDLEGSDWSAIREAMLAATAAFCDPDDDPIYYQGRAELMEMVAHAKAGVPEAERTVERLRSVLASEIWRISSWCNPTMVRQWPEYQALGPDWHTRRHD